ncbi:MAG: metallophosphoesterase family protein [Humidesulfovibrio sp.]|jgi:Icc-related predicted phosphoesterase|uniref:metallophosphoesterase family protein n=1 Tax=Humidesulfovibrio sp. TaxID=2910988 RepID=UPI002734FDC4|nr:metallophosphoesterase family protein [Humidesulfovibrio sp.]MDP2847030.1 metallophosphoesterase family protein [Humidesulfovibrio sp.]
MYWIVVGDVHESTGMFKRIPGIAEAEALIISGDLTNRGGPTQAEVVMSAALSANPRVLAQVGNMDGPSVTEHLALRGQNIHRQALLLAPSLALMGVGCSITTPFGTPSETTEQEMAVWLAETHAKAKSLAYPHGERGGHILAIIHNAPHGTRLDRLPNGMNVGSTAVRAFLEDAQPDICVCGHIHEGLGEERLGRCHVLNPGLLDDGGFIRVELRDGRLSASLGQI